MSDDASKFDPRFDPAFQRGYDGPPPAVAPQRTLRRSRSDSPPEPIGLPPQYSAVEQSVFAERPSEFLQPEVTGRRADDRVARELLELEHELEDAPRARNPFLAILGVVAVLLILGSVALLMNLEGLVERAMQQNNQTQFYYMQAIIYGAPMLIALGLATLIGVLFVYAVRWKRSA